MLAMMGGARRILEIGTYTGYTAVALAEALPPGGALVWPGEVETSLAKRRDLFGNIDGSSRRAKRRGLFGIIDGFESRGVTDSHHISWLLM